MEACQNLDASLGVWNAETVTVETDFEEQVSPHKETLGGASLSSPPQTFPIVSGGVQGNKRCFPSWTPKVEELLRVHPLFMQFLQPGWCCGVNCTEVL
jgi:hypothetical protein